MREIAPLLKNRSLFAESANFLLYDFWTENGTVDENVFAYSNRHGDQRAVIVFHNRFGHTRGSIHHSAAYADKGSGSLKQRSLQEGLDLPGDQFLTYRDTAKGLEYLRRSSDLVNTGLTLDLHAYQYTVLLNWRHLVVDKDHPWDRLHDSLHGAGVPSIDEALVRLKLKPLTDALAKVLDPVLLRAMADLAEISDAITDRDARLQKSAVSQLERDKFFQAFSVRAKLFLKEAHATCLSNLPSSSRQARVEEDHLEQLLEQRVQAALRIPRLEKSFHASWPPEARAVLPSHSPSRNAVAIWAPVLGWCLVGVLNDCLKSAKPDTKATDVFEQLRLRAAFAEIFSELGFEGEDSWRAAARIHIALAAPEMLAKPATQPETKVVSKPAAPTSPSPTATEKPAKSSSAVAGPAGDGWLWEDPNVRWLTGVHLAEDVSYFRKEPYEQLLWWTKLPDLIGLAQQPTPEPKIVASLEAEIQTRIAAAKRAGYKLDELLVPGSTRDQAAEQGQSEAPAQTQAAGTLPPITLPPVTLPPIQEGSVVEPERPAEAAAEQQDTASSSPIGGPSQAQSAASLPPVEEGSSAASQPPKSDGKNSAEVENVVEDEPAHGGSRKR